MTMMVGHDQINHHVGGLDRDIPGRGRLLHLGISHEAASKESGYENPEELAPISCHAICTPCAPQKLNPMIRRSMIQPVFVDANQNTAFDVTTSPTASRCRCARLSGRPTIIAKIDNST
jgi:hypothetical protein